MAKYRLKSRIFEAMYVPRITRGEDPGDWGRLGEWFGTDGPWTFLEVTGKGHVKLRTPEGEITAMPGEWIVRSTDGEAYGLVEDAFFRQTYEEIPEEKG